MMKYTAGLVATRHLSRSSPFVFFQAEDGIRDFHVTGVQTCALPICRPLPRRAARRGTTHRPPRICRRSPVPTPVMIPTASSGARSEERRVGEESRQGWSRVGETEMWNNEGVARDQTIPGTPASQYAS